MSHIALLLPDLGAGGAERIILFLAREFAARGHRVDLVLFRATGPLIESVPSTVRLIDLGASTHGLGQFGFGLSSIQRLTRWLRRERPDSMLSTITGANLVAVLARRASGVSIRLVIREAATLANVSSALRRRAMRWLYPQADSVIALSSVMAEQLKGQIGVPPDKVSCIPNPVDTAFVLEQAQAALADPWLDDERLQVVISAGRLVPQKDYATLIRAFALLPAEASARLIIVGEGPERSMLEGLAVELGIADRIKLPGFDPNPWRWMARADVFVLSSRSEGHPNALIEALALGVPAVVTEYDASAIAIATRFNLPTAPKETPKALAHALQQVLSVRFPRKSRSFDDACEAPDRYLAELS